MISRRLVLIGLQLAMASVALVIGWQIEPQLGFLPKAVLGGPRATDPPGTLLQLVAWFLGCQALTGVLAMTLPGAARASATSLVLRSFYAAVTGTALATLAVFLLTDLPFRSNLFVATFLALGLLFGLALVPTAARSSGTFAPHALAGVVARSLPTFEFAAAALSLGVLIAVLGTYLVSLDARNALNHFRSRESVEVSDYWQFTDRFEGLRLDQLIDLKYPTTTSDELFVLTRKGAVYRVDAATGTAQLVLDLGARLINQSVENGALALALHPDFGVAGQPASGDVYIWYTGFAEGQPARQVNRLSRFDLSAATPEARLATEQPLIDDPRNDSGFHNGGALLFGPDGMLYLSIGDLSEAELGQDLSERLASGILRIDVDQRGGEISAPISRPPAVGRTDGYFIPRDNPFFDVPDALQEYWAIGLRNPFRMWFDAERSAMWVGDVGADLFEEIDLLGPGGNGQWPMREGPESHDASVVPPPSSVEVEPLHFYRQTSVLRAVIGGLVYRGGRFPELQGQYLFADNQAGVLFRLDPADPAAGRVAVARAPQLASYGITSITEAPDGNLLITTLGAPDEASGRILALSRGEGAPAAESTSGVAFGQLYQTYCSRCHGDEGRGGPATSDMAARPDFTDPAWQNDRTDDDVLAVIRSGGEAMGLSSAMPAWGEVLDAAELQAVLEQVRSFGPQS